MFASQLVDCLGRNSKCVLVVGGLLPGVGFEVSKANTRLNLSFSFSLPTTCASGHKLLATASISCLSACCCVPCHSGHGLQ